MAHKERELRPSGLVPHVAYLLLDSSSSMIDDLQEAKEGALAFFRDALKCGYFVGLVHFASEAGFLCEPTRDEERFSSKLSPLEAGGSTDMAAAINLAAHLLNIGSFPRAVVLVTDGKPDDAVKTLAAAKQAKKSGIDVITIGTGGADREFLARLASRTDLARWVERSLLKEAISTAHRMLPG